MSQICAKCSKPLTVLKSTIRVKGKSDMGFSGELLGCSRCSNIIINASGFIYKLERPNEFDAEIDFPSGKIRYTQHIKNEVYKNCPDFTGILP